MHHKADHFCRETTVEIVAVNFIIETEVGIELFARIPQLLEY